MALLILLLICAAVVAAGAWTGYRSGAVAQLCMLLVLGLSYLAAAGVMAAGPVVAGLRAVPHLLQPLFFATLAAGSLYCLLTWFVRGWLRRLDGKTPAAEDDGNAAGPDENPEPSRLSRAPWNRRWGLVIGMVKGGVVAAVLFLGAHLISTATLAMETAIESGARTAAARRPALGAESPRERDRPPAPPAVSQPPLVNRVFLALGRDLKQSPLAPIAERVAPVKSGQIEAAGKLTILAEDEKAMRRFRGHAAVRRLMEHPRIRTLSTDAEVARLVEEKRWPDLMSHPAIVGLARDPEFLRDIREIDLEQIFAQISAPEAGESSGAIPIAPDLPTPASDLSRQPSSGPDTP